MRLFPRNPSPSLRSNVERVLRPALARKVDVADGRFTTVAPTSAIDATAANELARYGQLTTAIGDIDATFTALQADVDGKIDSSDLTAFFTSLLGKADRIGLAKEIGCPWIAANEGGNPVRSVGASAAAWAYNTLWSYTIPANALGSAVVKWQGSVLQNGGGNVAARIQLNGNTVWGTSNALTTSANRYPVNGEVRVARTGVNLQHVSSTILVGTDATPGAGGRGNYMFHRATGVHDGEGTESDSSDITVAYQVAFSTSSANHAFDLRHGSLVIDPEVP